MLTKGNKKLKQQIIESLSLSDFTKRQQDKVISGLMNNVFNKINIAILDLLTEDEKRGLEKLAKTRKKGVVLKYLSSKIKDFSSLPEEIARMTIEDFKRLRMKKFLIIIFLLGAVGLPITVFAALPTTFTELGVKIINSFWTAFTVIVVCCFIISGIFFLVAQGDPQKMALARAALRWGVVGAAVGLLASSVLPILLTWLS